MWRRLLKRSENSIELPTTKKEEDKAANKLANKDAKKAVAQAKEAEGKRFGDMLDKEEGRQNVFRIVK